MGALLKALQCTQACTFWSCAGGNYAESHPTPLIARQSFDCISPMSIVRRLQMKCARTGEGGCYLIFKSPQGNVISRGQTISQRGNVYNRSTQANHGKCRPTSYQRNVIPRSYRRYRSEETSTTVSRSTLRGASFHNLLVLRSFWYPTSRKTLLSTYIVRNDEHSVIRLWLIKLIIMYFNIIIIWIINFDSQLQTVTQLRIWSK